MRRACLFTSFFILTPLVLFISLIYLSFLSYNQKNGNRLPIEPNKAIAFAALPSNENRVLENIVTQDARIDILKQFFKQYGSPLEPFAKEIVKVSDFYNLDFRLLPAIAMQESNLCKKAPKNSFNCWGFGIYGKKVTTFNNYKEAINTVTKTLTLDYKNKGLKTPLEIMRKYTPSNQGGWAYSVSYFMDRLAI